MNFKDRLTHGWNAFMNKDPTPRMEYGYSYSVNPNRIRVKRGNEKSLINAVCNRIAVDCAAIDIKHVKLDDSGRYLEDYDSGLNECLTLSANIDQTGRAFRQDLVMSMLDEGVIAAAPIDTDDDVNETDSYDIESMRVAKVTEWFPRHVRLNAYNDMTGRREELVMPKSDVAIVENPFYSVMNEPNSTMQRLIRKLNLSDIIDEQNGSPKLDLIIQLPYQIKSDARRKQADERKKDIEMQLSTSQLGIAYIDGTEHVTQLNRSLENNMQGQIEYYTNMLFSQLGITMEILNGTADADAMNNYYSRTIEPIMAAICDEMKRKFLTKTARTRKQSIEFFRDPFKLVPVNEIAEIADKFTRNEIMTSNEVRQIVGMRPAADPRADELRNKNLSEAKDEEHLNIDGRNITDGYAESTNSEPDYEE